MAKEGITYEALCTKLRQKELAPVYLFFGEEDFLASEATDMIIAGALTPTEKEFNLDVVYGSEADARDIMSHASSFPMMAERRVVVVREFDKLQNKELLTSYIEHPSLTTSLVLVSTKPDFRKKPFTAAKKQAVVVNFAPLKDEKVPGWIMARVEQSGRRIDPDAGRLLASYAGASLREVQSELDKLFLYIGERSAITTGDVTTVVGISRDFNVFELQRAIGQKNMERSVMILERMLASGESPIMIIVMLTRYFTALWKLSDLRRRRVPEKQQAEETGLHPFYMREYMEALGLYSSSDVERAFLALIEADEQLKSSGQGDGLTMNLLLIKLMGQDLSVGATRLVG